MPDSNIGWQDDDFTRRPEPVALPKLASVAKRIRTHLGRGRSGFEIVDELRLFIMARLHQAPAEEIRDELVGWGLERDYADGLVESAFSASPNSKTAELARRMADADNASRPLNPQLAALDQPAESGSGAAAIALCPDRCPECDRVLYPVQRLRPTPALGWPARLLLIFGIILSGVTFLGGMAAARSVALARGARVSMAGTSIVWFPIAVLPALACAYLAYRLPRVARFGCRGCGWRLKKVVRQRAR